MKKKETKSIKALPSITLILLQKYSDQKSPRKRFCALVVSRL